MVAEGVEDDLPHHRITRVTGSRLGGETRIYQEER